MQGRPQYRRPGTFNFGTATSARSVSSLPDAPAYSRPDLSRKPGPNLEPLDRSRPEMTEAQMQAQLDAPIRDLGDIYMGPLKKAGEAVLGRAAAKAVGPAAKKLYSFGKKLAKLLPAASAPLPNKPNGPQGTTNPPSPAAPPRPSRAKAPPLTAKDIVDYGNERRRADPKSQEKLERFIDKQFQRDHRAGRPTKVA